MLFNSHEYLFLFLPGVLLFSYLFRRWGLLAGLGLVIASFLFYGYKEAQYLPLLIGSILFNFLVGRRLSALPQDQERKRKALLATSIGSNLAVLGYFKYFNFIVGNLNLLFDMGLEVSPGSFPLGISFFTFTQIAFLVDCYRRSAREDNPVFYSLLVTFFPYLLSGPIVRHGEVMSQFKEKMFQAWDYRHISAGLYLLFIGLFKKVALADRFSEWATAGFDGPGPLNFFYAWAASLSYTFQIYFDFSGYTDMALGAALMFHIKLPINFNSPYKALDVQDFWRRWHMSLSRFLRDYVYFPLGGSRVGEARIYFNLLVVFLICGLWHGAGWTFIFWGFLYGTAAVVQRFWNKRGGTLPDFLAWFLTFNFINVAWVFFRAQTWEDALKVLSGMFGLNGMALPDSWRPVLGSLQGDYFQFLPWKEIMQGSRDAYVFIPLALCLCLFFKNSNQMAERFKADWKSLIWVAAGAYAVLNMVKKTDFIYLNF
jgi:D-alanyl-lipoteichoic acid acyltransferase DltB (MBOAT superfamily)